MNFRSNNRIATHLGKNILTSLILLLLALPLLYKYVLPYPADYKLEGYTEPTGKPAFSARAFLSGDFQEQADKYLQDNVGFKGYLIALKNQLDYSLFNKLNYTIELGDEGQLFYWNHIDTRCGHLTISTDSFARKAAECAALQSLLDSAGIKTLYVLAPGKPYYYNDKLPARFKTNCTDDNDYHQVLTLLQQHHLPVVDYNAWYNAMRPVAQYPLFPKLGTHWSYYGATLAVDSITDYTAQALGVPLATHSVLSTTLTAQPIGKDKDLYDLANLLLPMHSDTLAYPQFTFTPTGKRKPKVLLIGDSFNWTLIDTKMLPQLFAEESRFWFYKKQLYTLDGKWITDNPNEVNLYELLKGTDMVIFLSTEALYHRFDHGLYNALLLNPAVADSLKHQR